MMQKVEFTNSKGQRLVGSLSRPDTEEKVPAVIFAHGFITAKNSKKAAELSRRIKDKIFLSFDFYGHGESFGKFEDITLTEQVDDLKNAIDFVYDLENFDNKNLTVIGKSFGASTSLIQVSEDKRVKNLVLVATAIKDPEEARQKNKERGRKLAESFYTDLLKYDGYKAAEKIECNTLLIHGSEDKRVPFSISQKLNKIIDDSKLKIIEGADHRFSVPEHFEKMINTIVDFIGGKK